MSPQWFDYYNLYCRFVHLHCRSVAPSRPAADVARLTVCAQKLHEPERAETDVRAPVCAPSCVRARASDRASSLRILYMPAVYAIISFLSYRFFRDYTYYDLIETGAHPVLP